MRSLTAFGALAVAACWWGGEALAAGTGEVSGFDSLLLWVKTQQREFSRALGAAVRDLRDAEGAAPLWELVVLSFVYGVFHAVGPGHGKAVISAYALTHETRARRTATVAMAAALVQGLTAVTAVGVVALVVEGSLRRAAGNVDDVLEPVSYGAVLAVGLYLAGMGGRTLYRQLRPLPSRHHGHDHDHDHDESCGCGHAPAPEQVAEASSWGKVAMIALSVGVRPCSGAILVLVLTFAFGYVGSGIAAVFAMSLGTGITVSVLALSAQGVRYGAVRMLAGWGAKAGPLASGLALTGGLFIAFVGASLLHGTLTAPAHPLM